MLEVKDHDDTEMCLIKMVIPHILKRLKTFNNSLHMWLKIQVGPIFGREAKTSFITYVQKPSPSNRCLVQNYFSFGRQLQTIK